jgi:hypothetical protein
MIIRLVALSIALTFSSAALAQQGGTATEAVPKSVLESQMKAATDSLQKSFAGLMLRYANGDAIDTTTTRRVFPFPMTSVRDFITAQLRRAGGSA